MSLIPGIRASVRSLINQAVTSSVALVNLTDFAFTAGLNAVIGFNLTLAFSVGATGGFRFRVSTPVGGTINARYQVLDTVTPFFSGGVVTALNTDFTGALAVAGTHQLTLSGVFVNSTTNGSFAIQFAQNNAQATPITVLAGALMEITRIN